MNLKAITATVALAGLLDSGSLAAETNDVTATGVRHGLHVEKGVLLRDGKPFRGVGVSFVDAFMGPLGNPADPRTEEAFKFLGEHGFPFVRTVASGWRGSPAVKLYASDKAEYFRRMDLTVALAEKCNVGLICSLFWPHWVQETTGETRLDAWTDPTSKTHEMMVTYVKEVVTRYRHSPAIWGWEWGNELVLQCHLPNAASFKIKPEDRYTYEVMRNVYAAFANEVRKHDAFRVISSGDTSLRDCGWHNWKEGSWTKDTPEQFAEVLSLNAPDPLDLLSIHAYDDDFKPHRLPVAAEVARKINKPLFVGEFGVKGPRTETSEKQFREQLAVLREQKVVLAALWEFDVKPIPRPEWLVSPTNDKRYMLDAIEELNRKWAGERR